MCTYIHIYIYTALKGFKRIIYRNVFERVLRAMLETPSWQMLKQTCRSSVV